MKKKNVAEFKMACERYLDKLSLNALRTYGRALKLSAPTTLKKEVLIANIISVLCGEFVPTRRKLGAPTKDEYLSPQVVETVEELQRRYLGEKFLTVRTDANEGNASVVDMQKKKTLPKIDTSKLNAVGTIRAIDELGRISVPIEARRLMGIKDRGLLEQRLYKDENDEIILVMRPVK